MPKKRRSPKEVVESDPFPEYEFPAIKFPLEEPLEVAHSRERDSTWVDKEKVNRIVKSKGGQKYTFLHTHPYTEGIAHYVGKVLPFVRDARVGWCFPSGDDLINFLKAGKEKAIVIQTRGVKTGKVYDTCVIRKTANTPPFTYNTKDRFLVDRYQERASREITVFHNYSMAKAELDEIAKEYGLQVRIMRGDKKRPRHGSKIEGMTSAIAILGSLFFFSSNITGNVIANLNMNSSNMIGTILLLIGLVIGIFYIKRK